jgi:hypothetical protein
MDIANIPMTEFTSSAVVVYAMQKVKTAKWFPLVQEGRAWVNRIVSIVAAALVSIGIAWSWTKDPATGTHTLVIMNIGLWSILHGFWHWLNQYALQETVYQATANKPGIASDAVGAVPAMVAPGGAVVVPPMPVKQ